MLWDACTFILDSDDPVRTVLIGGFFQVFAVFVLPLVAVLGYYIRVLRFVSGEVDTIPLFDRWKLLLYDGVRGLAIVTVYTILPLIAVGAVSLVLGLVDPVAAWIWRILGSLGVFVLMYLLPAALTNFSREHKVSAAFDFSLLHRAGARKAYLKPFLVSLVIVSVFTVALVMTHPLVSVVVLFASFYPGVVIMYMMADGFTSSLSQ